MVYFGMLHVLVVNEFWGCVGLIFEEYFWLELVWIWFGGVIVKRKIFGFKRKCCQNFVKTHVLVLAVD